MTISKARELLGKKVENLTDTELLAFISSTDKTLTHLMKLALKEHSLNRVDKDDTV